MNNCYYKNSEQKQNIFKLAVNFSFLEYGISWFSLGWVFSSHLNHWHVITYVSAVGYYLIVWYVSLWSGHLYQINCGVLVMIRGYWLHLQAVIHHRSDIIEVLGWKSGHMWQEVVCYGSHSNQKVLYLKLLWFNICLYFCVKHSRTILVDWGAT